MSNIIVNPESDTQKISFQSPPNLKKSDHNIQYRTRDVSSRMENIQPIKPQLRETEDIDMLINHSRKKTSPNLINPSLRKHHNHNSRDNDDNSDAVSSISHSSRGSRSSRSSQGSGSNVSSRSSESGSGRSSGSGSSNSDGSGGSYKNDKKNRDRDRGRNRDEDRESEFSGDSEGSGSSYETGSDTGTSMISRDDQRPKSYEEIQQEKQDLLYKLERMEKNGAKLSRVYTMASNIEDIRMEYNKIKREKDIDKSIQFSRNVMMAVVRGAEMLTKKFQLPVHLDGWSEECWENLSNYDEVFEKLHDKYSGRVSMPPELELIMMLGGSAFMYHVSHSLFKSSSIPNIDDILRQNPDIMRSVADAAAQSLRNQAPMNPMAGFMASGIGMATNNQQQQQQQQQSFNSPPPMQQRPNPQQPPQMMGFGGNNNPVPDRMMPSLAPTQRGGTQQTLPTIPNSASPPVNTKTMRGPSGMDDILSNLSNTAANMTTTMPRRQGSSAAKPAKANNTITIDL
jgi:hypothetical protein